MKKIAAFFIALVMAVTLMPVSNAAMPIDPELDALKTEFVFGEGPVADGYSVDYRYFSPVKENDSTKYPLVVWLHGMGDGAKDGLQVSKSQIAYWAGDDFQSRFEPAGGAFILAARSREEDNIYWGNEMVAPLKAAIDDFIAKNRNNIDLSRIYVGGYSMGGKMTLKMAIAYPEMFAAAFPICPAWSPDESALSLIADMPVWITSSTRDPLVNYYFSVNCTWEKLSAVTNIADDCRLSTLTKVCYSDGSKTSSSHHAWYAINYDMFAIDGGDYPYMTTVDAAGNTVELKYPDGMISWLTDHTSDYSGEASEGMGNLENIKNTDGVFGINSFKGLLEAVFEMLFGWIK